MKQRLLRILEDLEDAKGTVGKFKGFAELDREARERGFEIYPLTRPGTCTVMLNDFFKMVCRECGNPAIVNRARPTNTGWQMDDICPWHLKQELRQAERTKQ